MFGGSPPRYRAVAPDLDDLPPSPAGSAIDPGELGHVILKALLDAVVVGGIVFFSSLVGIGWQNFFEVAWVSFLSAIVTVGLNFFTSLRKYLSGGGL
jgi:hypothetical protein